MTPKIATSVLTAPALAVLLLVGCEEKLPEPKPTTGAEKAAGASTTAAAAQQRPAGVAEIVWKKPDAWEQVDHPSPMRKATYKIPRAEGDPEDGEMSVTQVGGSVKDNIVRWEGQFEENDKAKTTEKEVGGVTVTVVELTGTYKGGGPMMGGGGEPKKDWMLLAAIAHTEPTAHFFKATGPRKTLEAARGDFDVLVGSIAKK